jgi:hypothetical protein
MKKRRVAALLLNVISAYFYIDLIGLLGFIQ